MHESADLWPRGLLGVEKVEVTRSPHLDQPADAARHGALLGDSCVYRAHHGWRDVCVCSACDEDEARWAAREFCRAVHWRGTSVIIYLFAWCTMHVVLHRVSLITETQSMSFFEVCDWCDWDDEAWQ